jgi:Glycosyl transferase family 2
MRAGADLNDFMSLKINVVCAFFQEEFLVPFFLSHYSFADRIHALATPGNDRTVELLKADPRVELHYFESPAGMDDGLKIQKINALVAAIGQECDWIIVVDSDELVWPENWSAAAREGLPRNPVSVVDFLSLVPGDESCVMARMWQVFRHESDADLDVAKTPVFLQRRHGCPDRESPALAGYCKPIVIRANHGFQFTAGQHRLEASSRLKFSSRGFDGAHWANADPCFAVGRILRGRRDRMSAHNKVMGMGVQYFTIDEGQILGNCQAHRQDPQLF